MRILFRRRPRTEPGHDIMKNSNAAYPMELATHDGDRSSVRSSDDGASGSPSGCDGREKMRVYNKIDETKQKIMKINLDMSGNVDEFLKLSRETEAQSGSIDNPQMIRIRQQFEKKNRRHAQETEQLQKKLQRYEQRASELERGICPDMNSRSHISQMGHGMRRTGAHIKEMTETVVSAPMELAHRLKKNTFGSADNVNVNEVNGDDSRVGQSVFYASSEHGSAHNTTKSKSSTLPAGLRMDASGVVTSHHLDQSAQLNESSLSLPFQNMDPVFTSTPNNGNTTNEQLRNLQDAYSNMEGRFEQLTATYKSELADITRSLEEEKYKNKKLEDQLNETIELHQAEFISLKQEQKTIANRLDYQYNDRFRHVEDSVESAKNQICRLENSIKQTLDVKLASADWGNAVLLSTVNIGVESIRIALYLIAIVLDVFRPFTGSRYRAGAFLFLLLSVFLFFNYVDVMSLFRRRASSSSPSEAAAPSVTSSTEL